MDLFVFKLVFKFDYYITRKNMVVRALGFVIKISDIAVTITSFTNFGLSLAFVPVIASGSLDSTTTISSAASFSTSVFGVCNFLLANHCHFQVSFKTTRKS